MKERSNDLRVVKTIQAIHTAFESMLCEMEYSQITVKALCERALVNKKTFYRYYQTMDFLMAEFQEEMMNDYLEMVKGLCIPEDMEQITRAFFAYAQARGAVFERITCAASYERVQEQLTDSVMARHNRNAALSFERSLLMAFVRESTLAIYRQWVADGKPISNEAVTEIAVHFVCEGTNAFTLTT